MKKEEEKKKKKERKNRTTNLEKEKKKESKWSKVGLVLFAGPSCVFNFKNVIEL